MAHKSVAREQALPIGQFSAPSANEHATRKAISVCQRSSCGQAVGTNIANLLVILGITADILPVPVPEKSRGFGHVHYAKLPPEPFRWMDYQMFMPLKGKSPSV